jgi:hypothetical protein
MAARGCYLRGAVLSVARGEHDVRSWNAYYWTMTIALDFITALQQQLRIGKVSSETEQHLKHEFRKLGRDASGPTLAVAVEAEIARLEIQAATLRRLRESLLAVV